MSVDANSSGQRHHRGGSRPLRTSSPPRRPSSRRPSGGASPSYRRAVIHQRSTYEFVGPERPAEAHACPSSSASSWSSFYLEHDRGGRGGGGPRGSDPKVDRTPKGHSSTLLRYKTELCRTFEENGMCRFGNTCTFAHGIGELRATPRHPRYKTEACRQYHAHGICQYGARCHFVHDLDEAAGVSPMPGFLKWTRDRLSNTLLALAEDAGIALNPDTSDILLANLRRLFALRAMKEQPDLSDAPTLHEPCDGNENMSFQSEGMELPTNLPESLSAGMFETGSNCSMYNSAQSASGSPSMLCNNFDTSHEPLLEPSLDNSIDNATDQSTDTGFWSSAWSTSASLSTSPPGESWWGIWSGSMTTPPPPLSPESTLGYDTPMTFGQPAITHFLPHGLDMDLPKMGTATKLSVKVVTGVFKESVIASPMEVSRGLQLPSITELCQN